MFFEFWRYGQDNILQARPPTAPVSQSIVDDDDDLDLNNLNEQAKSKSLSEP